MNEIKTSCAPADSRNLTWDGMNWSKCETYVRKLQARIVKAQKEGRHNKVKTLQWMLTHSFYAKALAVKRVTSNKGKNTSGVDKQLWDSPKRKYKAIGELRRRGYHPQPLRRVHIKIDNFHTLFFRHLVLRKARCADIVHNFHAVHHQFPVNLVALCG